MTIDDLKKQYDAFLPSYYKNDSTISLKLEVLTKNLEHDIKTNIDKGFSATEAAIVATSSAYRMANMNYALTEAALNVVGKNYIFKKTPAEILRQAAFRCLATVLDFPNISPESENNSTAAFPINALPTAIRNFVISVVDSYQVPLEMAGPISLGVLSAAALKKFVVRELSGHLNPLCLYIAVCADSGERKSSTLAAFTKVLVDYEAWFNRSNAEKIDKTLLAARRIKYYEELALKKEEYESKHSEAKAAFTEMEKVYPLRLTVDDATPEALTNLLAACGERAAIISAEGGFLDVIAGCYNNKNPKFDILLHAHNAEPYSVDRISRPTDTLSHPELAIVLAVQPDVIRTLISNGSFAGRGLLARFLFAVCQSRIGSRSYIVPEIPAAAKKAYEDAVLRLLELPSPKDPVVLNLSNDANNALAEYFDYFDKVLMYNPNRKFDGSAKHIGTVVRIAGLLHVVDDPTAAEPISEDELNRAIDIAEFFRYSADTVFTGTDPSLADPDKEYLLDVIKHREFAVCEKTALFTATRSRFNKTNQLDAVLTKLEKDGWVCIKKINPPTGRPSIIVVANPMLFYDD